MTNRHAFRPDWASAPGETIADVLAERSLSIDDFARLMEYTPEEARDLLEGRATISIGIARRLEQALGAPVEFWMSRDYQYRQNVARLHVADQEWLRELPIGDMIKFGWLSPVPHPQKKQSHASIFLTFPMFRHGVRHMRA